MATSKRVSKTVVKGVTEAQYLASLAAYAAADARAFVVISKMDEQVTKIREKFDGEIERLRQECDTHYEIVQTYCEENKETLFEKKRSLETTHGVVGFRTGTPKLKLMPKMNWEKVLDNLKHYLPAYVRTVTEPAKDRLLADRDQEEVATLLPKCGINVDQDEKFFIELKKEVG